MGEKDAVTKTVQSHDSVFADIVNGLLFDGECIINADDLIPADKESQYKISGEIKSQERDVSKFWQNTHINIAFIGIENQVEPDRFMPLRIINYDGSVYRNQYKEIQEKKDKICYPVITLVIYLGKKEWTYGKNLHSCLNIPDVLLPYVSDYKINLFSIKDMQPEQIKKFKSDFRAIAEFFYALNNGLEYHPSDQVLKYPEETLDMISVFSDDERFRDEYNAIKATQKGEITMCEIYDKILMEGEAKGEAKGRAKGRAEGRLSVLTDLVRNGIITITQAAEQEKMPVEEFSKLTGLPVQ